MPIFRFRLKIDLTLLVISNLHKLTLFITREFARFLAMGWNTLEMEKLAISRCLKSDVCIC